MPYFNHSMAKSVQSNSRLQLAPKKIRSLPGNAPHGSTVIAKDSESSYRSRYRYEVSARKLLFMRSLIRAQVCQLMNAPPPQNIDMAPQLFADYQIDTSKLLYEDEHLKMYEVMNKPFPDFPTLVRIYSRQDLDPNSMYLKILRHLGCKHPKLVGSCDIFYNETSLYVFQEFVAQGNLMTYLEKNPGVSVAQAQFWAKQLFDSLDFLGDQAIAHGNLSPIHLLVKATGNELWLKLTGFQCAIIYWDMATNDIQFCPCRSAEKQKTDGPNFQAPEIYGDSATEEFDPILADTWSYGANVYYMLAKQYPYNVFGTMEDLDREILANIRHLTTLNADGQDFLYSTMRANANDRMPFDFIGRSPWLKLHKSGLAQSTVIHTPFKVLEKVKVSSRKSQAKSSKSSKMSKIPSGGLSIASRSSMAGSSASSKTSVSASSSIFAGRSPKSSASSVSGSSSVSSIKSGSTRSKTRTKVKTLVKLKSKSKSNRNKSKSKSKSKR